MAGIVIWESGRPFTVYSGSFTASNVVQSTANCENCPDGLGYRQQETGRNFFFNAEQRSLFSFPAAGDVGNTGRNYFTAPTLFRLDLTVGKKIPLTERTNLEIRMEVQNATNHPSFDIPTAVFTSSTFGRINDSVVSTARRIQWAAKFSF